MFTHQLIYTHIIISKENHPVQVQVFIFVLHLHFLLVHFFSFFLSHRYHPLNPCREDLPRNAHCFMVDKYVLHTPTPPTPHTNSTTHFPPHATDATHTEHRTPLIGAINLRQRKICFPHARHIYLVLLVLGGLLLVVGSFLYNSALSHTRRCTLTLSHLTSLRQIYNSRRQPCLRLHKRYKNVYFSLCEWCARQSDEVFRGVNDTVLLLHIYIYMW